MTISQHPAYWVGDTPYATEKEARKAQREADAETLVQASHYIRNPDNLTEDGKRKMAETLAAAREILGGVMPEDAGQKGEADGSQIAQAMRDGMRLRDAVANGTPFPQPESRIGKPVAFGAPGGTRVRVLEDGGVCSGICAYLFETKSRTPFVVWSKGASEPDAAILLSRLVYADDGEAAP